MSLDLVSRLLYRAMRLQGYQRHVTQSSIGPQHNLIARGEGSLPPMILLHGLHSHAAHYMLFARYLRPHVRQLILPDMPWHGLSCAPDTVSARHAQTGIDENLLKHTQEPAIIFGISLGGFAAARFAAQYPERVAALILCSPAGATVPSGDLDDMLQTLEIHSFRDAQHFVQQALNVPKAIELLLAGPIAYRFRMPGAMDLIRSLTQYDLLQIEELARLTMPSLLVWGEADQLQPTSAQQFFANHLPPPNKVIRPHNFSHAAFVEHPKNLADMMLDFCRAQNLCDRT